MSKIKKKQRGGGCYQLGLYDKWWNLSDLQGKTVAELQRMNYDNFSILKSNAKIQVPPVLNLKFGPKYDFMNKDLVVVVKCETDTKNLPFAFNLAEVMRQILVSTCNNKKRTEGMDILVNPISQMPYSPEIIKFFNDTFQEVYKEKLSLMENVKKGAKDFYSSVNPTEEGISGYQRTSRAASLVGLGLTAVSFTPFAFTWIIWIGIASQIAQTYSINLEKFIKSDQSPKAFMKYLYSVYGDVSGAKLDWTGSLSEKAMWKTISVTWNISQHDINQFLGYMKNMANINKNKTFDVQFAKKLLIDEKRRQKSLSIETMKNPKKDLDSFQKACTLGRFRKSVKAVVAMQRMQRLVDSNKSKEMSMTKHVGKNSALQVGAGKKKRNTKKKKENIKKKENNNKKNKKKKEIKKRCTKNNSNGNRCKCFKIVKPGVKRVNCGRHSSLL